MERILITGSQGFLGQALSQELSKHNQIVPGDRLGKCPPIDYVIDLASYGNAYDQTDLTQIYETNVMRLVHLVEDSKQHPIKGMIFTSSAVVTQPNLNAYGASKLAVEALAQSVTHCPVVTLRPFTVTGVGDQPHHLIPTLIRSCLEQEPIPFVPTPTHDYIDIDDVVKGYYSVLKNMRSLKGKVLDLGTGRNYTNEQVKDMVEETVYRQANLTYVDSLREYDSTNWIADPERMVRRYSYKKPLQQSIQEMIDEKRRS